MATWFGRNVVNVGGGWSTANQTTQAITGPVATVAYTEPPETVAASVLVQKDLITHVFKDTAGNVLSDGINVVAFIASTMANANPTIAGSGLVGNVNVGVGEVQIIVADSSSIILIPDHAHASFPTGEVGHSPPIVPAVV